MASVVAPSLQGASGASSQTPQPLPIPYEALVEITDLGACRGCAGSLERALRSLSGVRSVVLESERPWLRLVVDSEHRLDLPAIRQTVRDKGYSSGRITLRWGGFDRE